MKSEKKMYKNAYNIILYLLAIQSKLFNKYCKIIILLHYKKTLFQFKIYLAIHI